MSHVVKICGACVDYNAQSDQGLCWQLTKSLDTVGYIDIYSKGPYQFVQLQLLIWIFVCIHHENTMPIQIYWKFHHQKLKVFR